ncbi:hypothetical protein [Marinifilum fragile]|uniref:hypothetical protein n=1 Tax=Marinifilum fragile TaxID=570161 RepID=UPI002AA7A446|nr:hypothetical protein [Marinifilum fragile]
MNTGFTLKRVVEYSAVFNDKPNDLDSFLSGIKRSRILNAVAFFLGFSNRNSKYESHKEFISMFFCAENNELANEIYQKLEQTKFNPNEELIIINPLTGLQLFEFCFNNLNEEETQTEAEAERNIFKAILFQNEQNTIAQNKSAESTKKLDSNIKLASLALTQSFAYNDIINYEKGEVLACQMIKSIYLFEFLESREDTKYLLAKFLAYFETENWKDYLKSVLPIAFSVIQAENEAHTDIIVDSQKDSFEKDCEFIEKLIVKDVEELNDFDFIKLRSNPLYKVKNGVYRIIYGLFIIELLHKGLYFKLSELNRKLKKSQKVKGEFRGFYCDEFSEKYLLYRIMDSIYENRYIKFSGEQIKALNVSAEPDYYIRNGNNVLLFESKDILVNAKIKHTYDFEKYEAAFKKKLYYDEEDGKIEKKAVLQLLNNIERILDKELPHDNNYKSNSIKIYPILVLHDHQFNISGLNLIINNWFQDELEKLKNKGYNISKIRPITIIDIDTFIYYQDYLRNRTLKLEKVIDEYYKFITFDRKKKYRDEDHAKQHVQRTLIPFSIFLSNYVTERKIPKMLKEKGYLLFD